MALRPGFSLPMFRIARVVGHPFLFPLVLFWFRPFVRSGFPLRRLCVWPCFGRRVLFCSPRLGSPVSRSPGFSSPFVFCRFLFARVFHSPVCCAPVCVSRRADLGSPRGTCRNLEHQKMEALKMITARQVPFRNFAAEHNMVFQRLRVSRCSGEPSISVQGNR